MTGNEGLVQACGDTLAHTHMSNAEQKDILFRVWCLRVGVLFFFSSFFLEHVDVCAVMLSVCGSPVLQLRDQAQTGSPMWVNCDLAISLPGGDKSSPCWCVNHSVITSSCHDRLRMQASGNLHCRCFTDRREKHTATLSRQLQRVLNIR